jgi:hypothetical protein
MCNTKIVETTSMIALTSFLIHSHGENSFTDEGKKSKNKRNSHFSYLNSY